jgi:uncharacterized membrane protein/mono/diheme cytochrome c family protein
VDPTLEAWLQLLGRLHPVLVHFPIALLLVAFLFELFGLRKSGGGSSLTLLGLGAASAVVAATAGWFWADFEPPSARDAEALDWHRWTGVATASLALLAWILALVARKRTDGPFLGLARLLLLGSCVGVGLAGHQGGSLVHGEQHLTAPLEQAWALTFGDGEPAPPSDPDASTGRITAEERVDGALVGEFAGTTENVFAADDASGDAEAGEADPAAGDTESPEGAQGSQDAGDSEDDGEDRAEANDEAASATGAAEVLAIFARNCADCHGAPPAKADAGLRLHTAEALAEGIGEDPLAALIVPGNVEGSYLYERISYPAGDADLMPPPDDGYERLADAEIAAIAAWIEAGAPLGAGGASGAGAGANEAGDESAAKGAGSGSNAAAASTFVEGSELDALPAEEADVEEVLFEETSTAEVFVEEPIVEELVVEEPQSAEALAGGAEDADPFGIQGAPDAQALQALVQAGALAGRVADDTQAVDVDLHLLRDEVGDAELAWLAGLESHLVHLHLGGTAISDAGLAAVLPEFTELRTLNVSRTAVGAATVAAAAALPHLEVLNLYGTRVDDAGVLVLASAPALERVYLWDSEVTADGGRALAELRPDLKIDPAEWFAEPVTEDVVELPPAEAVDYAADIGPIFEARCVNCHGATDPKAGLRLDDLSAHFARPQADWVIVPGDPDGSPLIARVEYAANTPGAMPPKGERLDADQIELLRRWILQGADR